MESRMFIKAAQQLITEMKEGVAPELHESVQKEIGRLFMSLQNPTLPSALKLRDCAVEHGFFLSPRIMQLLHQGETIWSFGI